MVSFQHVRRVFQTEHVRRDDMARLQRTKESNELSAARDTACANAYVRGIKPPKATEQLIRDQTVSAEMYANAIRSGQIAPPPRVYFADPSNFESCYRQVRRSFKRVKDSLAKQYRGLLGEPDQAEADVVGQLDAIITSGFAAWDNQTAHPMRQAAGIRAALEAMKIRARLLGINVDGKYSPTESEDSPARVAVRAIAEAAKLLRDDLEQQGVRLPPSRALIDVTNGKIDDDGPTTN